MSDEWSIRSHKYLHYGKCINEKIKFQLKFKLEFVRCDTIKTLIKSHCIQSVDLSEIRYQSDGTKQI